MIFLKKLAMASPVNESSIVTPMVRTLFHLALVKVSLRLLNDFSICLNAAYEDLREPKIKLRNGNTPFNKKVNEAIKKLRLIPPPLRVRVMEAVEGLDFEICQWKKGHPSLEYEDCVFIWRSEGSIDRIKTARQLVVDTSIGIRDRFYFACVYCLEDSIQTLWVEMEASGKTRWLTSYPEMFRHTMVPFWVGHIHDGSAIPWKQVAVEYLDTPVERTRALDITISSIFPLLQPEDRRKFLHFFEDFCFDKDLRFCLFAMTTEEQEQVLRMCAWRVLKSYSEWPLRNLFFQVAEKLWHYINEDTFCYLLDHILDQMPPLKDLEDFEYCEFFEQVWNMSADHFKEKALECSFGSQQIYSCFSEIRKKKEKLKMK